MRARSLAALALCWMTASCSDGGGGPGPEDTPSLMRACVRAQACGYQPYPRLADCVANYTGRIAAAGMQAVASLLYGCVDRARTCGEVATCYGARGDCDQSFVASCEAGDAIYCDLIDKRAYTHRCSAAGMACQLDSTYRWSATCTNRRGTASTLELDCGDELCPGTGVSCGGPSDPNDRCAGDDLESCLGGEWRRFSCAALALGPCRSEGSGASTNWARCTPPPL